MPFLPNNLWDEEKLRQQNSNNISGQSSNIQTNNPTGRVENKSGSWVNLNKYLDSNKEGASQMGSDIAGSIDNQGNDAQSQANSKIVNPDSEVKYDTQKLNSDFYNDPVSADKSKYDKIKSGLYEGPQGVSDDINEVANKSSQVSNKANAAFSEAGRKGLLEEQYKRPEYSYGQKNLDNMLIQGNSQAKESLNQAGNRWKDLSNLVTGKVTDYSNRIAENKKAVLDNANLLRGSEDSVLNEVKNPIQTRVDAAKADADALRGRLTDDLSDDIVSDETWQKLGLQGPTDLYDVDARQFLNVDANKYNLGNQATEQERARFNALAKLMGQDNNQLTDDKLSNFNRDDFTKAVDARKNAFESQYNPAKQEFDVLDAQVKNAWEAIRASGDPSSSAFRNAQVFLSQNADRHNQLKNTILPGLLETYKPNRKLVRG